MEKQNTPDFIVVDDDPTSNKICTWNIKKTLPDADIKAFTEPQAGLEFIYSKYLVPEAKNAILFLDINMPNMTGWEFMEHFEEFDPKVKKRIKVFIVSSSVDSRDIERAESNKNILAYIVKPINKEIIQTRIIQEATLS